MLLNSPSSIRGWLPGELQCRRQSGVAPSGTRPPAKYYCSTGWGDVVRRWKPQSCTLTVLNSCKHCTFVWHRRRSMVLLASWLHPQRQAGGGAANWLLLTV